MGTASPFGIVRLDPTQEERCMEKTYKVSNFEAVSAMESKKAGGGGFVGHRWLSVTALQNKIK